VRKWRTRSIKEAFEKLQDENPEYPEAEDPEKMRLAG
jgi:hypothetical protein